MSTNLFLIQTESEQCLRHPVTLRPKIGILLRSGTRSEDSLEDSLEDSSVQVLFSTLLFPAVGFVSRGKSGRARACGTDRVRTGAAAPAISGWPSDSHTF